MGDSLKIRASAVSYQGEAPWGYQWWLDYVFGLHRSTVHLPIEKLTIRPDISVSLNDTLNALVCALSGHQAIGAHYTTDNGRWMVEVPAEFSVNLHVYKGRRDEVEAFQDQELQTPVQFDAPATSSLRVAVVQDGTDVLGIILTFPGTLFDWVSKEILREEIQKGLRSSRARSAGTSTSPTFSELVRRDRTLDAVDRSQQNIEFWGDVLRRLPSQPAVSTASGRHDGQCRRFSLRSGALRVRVGEKARVSRALPAAVVIASIGLSMRRVLRIEEPVFSVGFSTRSDRSEHRAVGAFVRSVPIVVSHEQQTLAVAARQVSGQLLSAIQHIHFDPQKFAEILRDENARRAAPLTTDNRFSVMAPNMFAEENNRFVVPDEYVIDDRTLDVKYYNDVCWQLGLDENRDTTLSITCNTAAVNTNAACEILAGVYDSISADSGRG